jgi:hypothetical protein
MWTALLAEFTSIYHPSLTVTSSISETRSWSLPMTDGTQEFHPPLQQAFEELLRLYRMLELENELLRGQLRRHPVGELQIRETERKMMELRGSTPLATPDHLTALMVTRPE